MMRRALALAMLTSATLFVPASAHADDQVPIATPPVPTAAPDTLGLDTLGLGTDQPGRLTVPVTIGSTGPYHFTIDTGAERTVISRELAMTLGLERGRDVHVTGMTGQGDVTTVIIPALNVSRTSAARIEAPMISAENLGALGLLGIDTLKNQAVLIDFDANTMAVSPSTKRHRRYVPQPGEIVVQAKSLLGQLVVTDAYYRGRRVRVVLDTGSVVSMGNLALRQSAGRAKAPIQTIALSGVTGGLMAADYTQIGEVRIGDVTFRNLPVAFSDALPFRRLGLNDSPALLLGMDALKQFRHVEIDFANREVRLTLPRDAG